MISSDNFSFIIESIASIEGDGGTPALVFSDLILVDEHDRETGCSFMETRGIDGRPANPLGTLLRHNLVTGCTITCNRALLKRSMPFPENIVMHDWWLALVAAATGRIEMLDAPTVRYRLHGGNQVGAQSLLGWEGMKRIMPGVESRKALARVFRQDQELGRRLGDELDRLLRRDDADEDDPLALVTARSIALANVCVAGLQAEIAAVRAHLTSSWHTGMTAAICVIIL